MDGRQSSDQDLRTEAEGSPFCVFVPVTALLGAPRVKRQLSSPQSSRAPIHQPWYCLRSCSMSCSLPVLVRSYVASSSGEACQMQFLSLVIVAVVSFLIQLCTDSTSFYTGLGELQI